MQLQQVEVIGAQAAQTALDAGFEQAWVPIGQIGQLVTYSMSTFCKEIKVIAAAPSGAPDDVFASAVAFRCIDNVDASCIQGIAYQTFHLCQRDTIDLDASQAQHRNLHVRFAELACFHKKSAPLYRCFY